MEKALVDADSEQDFTITGSPLFILGLLVERLAELTGGSDNVKIVLSATMHVQSESGRAHIRVVPASELQKIPKPKARRRGR